MKGDFSKAIFGGKIWEKIKNNKYVLIVVVLGLVLLLIPTGNSSRKTDSGNVSTESAVVSTVEFSLEKQEKKLSDALSKIDGAGKVTVMLTLKTSTEQILAQDSTESYSDSAGGEARQRESSVSTVVISVGSSLESAVTLKYIYPEYLGALIVAEGAGNASVRLAITNAVSAVTGLKTDKITVVKMNKS